MSTRVDVQVTGDARGATSAIRATDSELRGLRTQVDTVDKSMGGLRSSLTKIGGALLAAGGIRAGMSALGDAIGMAADRTETLGKVDVVFGRNAAAIKAWAKTSTASLTATETSVLDTVASFDILLGNKGIGGPAGQRMSKQLTELATDLASFFNTDVSQAADAINSALRGEMDPIEQFGVSLNDAALKAQALKMGLYSGKGTLDDYAKAMAAYKLILQQTAQAQGDVERTQGSAANQMRMFSVGVLELKENIGHAFEPLIERFGPAVNRWLGDLNTRLGSDGFSGWMDDLGDTIDKAGRALKTTFEGITLDDLKENLRAAGEAAGDIAEFGAAAMRAFNDLSPATKKNLALIVAAGAAVGLASKNPVVKIGVDLVSGTVQTIATTIASSMASKIFDGKFAQRVIVTNWPAGAFTGGGVTTGKAGKSQTVAVTKNVALSIAALALPWLLDKVGTDPGTQRMFSTAAYTAMGMQMFGPLGGVGGFIYGMWEGLHDADRDIEKRADAMNAQYKAMADKLASQSKKVDWLDKKVGGLGTAQTYTERDVKDLYKNKASKDALWQEEDQRRRKDAYLQAQLNRHWSNINALFRAGRGYGQNNPSIGTQALAAAYGYAARPLAAAPAVNVTIQATDPLAAARELRRMLEGYDVTMGRARMSPLARAW